MSRRTTELVLTFTLGAWLAETVGLWIAAGQSFALVDRVYFQIWNVVQMALGAAALFLVYRSNLGRAPLILAGSALGTVLLLAVLVTPSIVRIGRSLDFLLRQPPPAEVATFGAWHGAYMLLDLVKALLLAALVVLILRRRALPA